MSKTEDQLKSEMLVAMSETKSARAAAILTNMPYGTFISRAKRFGIYQTNQCGKGIVRNQTNKRFNLDEILAGKHPHYTTGALKRRIIRDGRLPVQCNQCGLGPEWNNAELVLVLDHINGINDDHRLDNLQLLCPNCHSQTTTFAGRNRGTKKRTKISNNEMINAIETTDNIHEALIKLEMLPNGANYKRVQRLKDIIER